MRNRIIERNMFYGAKGTLFEIAKGLRKNMTLAELILWKKLKDRKLFKVKFRRQHPIDIFIIDFYCHQYKLVIEVDGEIHFDPEKKEYDLGRTEELKRFGIRIIRFTNDQIIFDMDKVITEIHKTITALAPL